MVRTLKSTLLIINSSYNSIHYISYITESLYALPRISPFLLLSRLRLILQWSLNWSPYLPLLMCTILNTHPDRALAPQHFPPSSGTWKIKLPPYGMKYSTRCPCQAFLLCLPYLTTQTMLRSNCAICWSQIYFVAFFGENPTVKDALGGDYNS